ncbi:unnamed protein product [Menidia menidia]|uniref:Cyclin-dependent kinase inhibitor 1B n=1 Tax=Menidia menidia TaxID=238744 RepID=A0A8S4B8L3_9TELE|nr:unnamed protein product [Menidia menidia]
MSDVRLSNGSPTLERTDPRLPEHPKPSACKSLFGPVDHEELKKDFNAHLRELEEAAAARWDFDFANDQPLANGRLQWELVEHSSVPDFYSRPPRENGVCSGNNNVDHNGNHHCDGMAQSEETSRADSQMECTEQSSGPRKRSACHDPSAQSKRSHTSPEEVSCPNLSHSAEHTPRKTRRLSALQCVQ